MVNWAAVLVGAAVGVSFLALVGIVAVLFSSEEDDNERKRKEASTSDRLLVRSGERLRRSTLYLKLDGKFMMESFSSVDDDKANHPCEVRNTTTRVFTTGTDNISDVD